jgi:hypothetical protein
LQPPLGEMPLPERAGLIAFPFHPARRRFPC